MSKAKEFIKVLDEVAFKFCKKCVAMTPHKNNECSVCNKGKKK